MLSLSAAPREKFGRKANILRKQGLIPAILYGPKIKALPLALAEREFEGVYREAGESTLVNLKVDKQSNPVLIHEVQKDPISGQIIHVDLYQPSLEEKVTIKVPLVFEGEAPAVKELGGTLLKVLDEIEVSALPQNLPHEIVVDVETLKSFEDRILVKDLAKSDKVEILNPAEAIIAQVVPPEKVEEELAKPVEEGAPEVEVVKKEEAKEEAAPEEQTK